MSECGRHRKERRERGRRGEPGLGKGSGIKYDLKSCIKSCYCVIVWEWSGDPKAHNTPMNEQ